MRKTFGILVTMTMLATACTTGAVNPSTIHTTTTTRHLGAPASMAFALQPFDACEPLLEYVKEHALELVGPYGLGYGYWGGGPWLVDEMAMEDTATPATSGATRNAALQPGIDYSTTNVQEVGVDEPDIVKTDGTRILAIAQGVLYYVDVSGGKPELTGSLQLDNSWAQEMLLSGDTLLVMSRTNQWDVPVRLAPEIWNPDIPYYGAGISVLSQVDISDPDDMHVVRTLFVDGSYLSARMVGDTARVVVDSYPTGLEFVYPTGSGLRAERDAERANRQVIEDSTIDNWLPYFVMEEKRGNRTITTEGTLLECEQTFAPREFSGLGTLSVLTIDLSEGLEPTDAVGLFADGDTVYASQESLYVATQRWHDWSLLDDADAADEFEGVTTEIHQFNISGEKAAVYLASGEVEGFLLNQWAMSEHNGDLRVATTSEPEWWGWRDDSVSESFIQVLREDDGVLEVIGEIGELGKGERIYSVRYMGDMAYVVTFRQTDPLYTIDLSNPRAPKVLGELKILGYSAYLHPMGDDLLLGIGQDADEQGRNKGTQVAVFDVSDPANPKRIHKMTFDDGWSEVEYDHRAFLYWPATGLTMLPIQAWSWEAGREDWFAGAIGVIADRDGIEDVGTVTHIGPKPGGAEEEYGYDWQAQIHRSIVIGDLVYTMSEKGLKASSLTDLSDVAWVSFR
ncbi:MAG: beta-propeller domain-containing protein [Acidimicrobiia bacterium]|nr:beta-propeller domain-containing protein [Acidimicrobiia bacterium]